MEFIFGTRLYDGKECEYLKTEGESFTEFNDGEFNSYCISTPLMIITHKFRIIKMFKKEVDKQGNHCTWYYIDNHTIDTDRSPSYDRLLNEQKSQLIEQSEIIDDILIELLRRGY